MRMPRRSRPPHPQPVTFECAACAQHRKSPDHLIPVGWSRLGAVILCEDCTASAKARALHRERKAKA